MGIAGRRRVALLDVSKKRRRMYKPLSAIEVVPVAIYGAMHGLAFQLVIALVALRLVKSLRREQLKSRTTFAKCASAWTTNTFAIIHDALTVGQHLPSILLKI